MLFSHIQPLQFLGKFVPQMSPEITSDIKKVSPGGQKIVPPKKLSGNSLNNNYYGNKKNCKRP